MKKTSVQISAVIITHNEESNIERCLMSLKGVADEIVVVDSFSTDATRAICEKYGVRFWQHEFEGFAEQKNRANAQASYPYILSLDADEALSEELRESIISIKQNWEGEGYRVKRLNNYCGKWIRNGGYYPDMKLRLFDVRQGEWQGVKIHEAFRLHSSKKTPVLKGDLLHYTCSTIFQHVNTVNKFSSLKAELAFEKGKRPGILPMLFSPCLKFIKIYFIKGGLLDGFLGFVIAVISAYGVFLKYAKLREMKK